MSDTPAQAHVSVPHKVRQLLRGGGGRHGGSTHSHSRNKTWVSGQSPSPAPDGRWERGRGGLTMRGRRHSTHPGPGSRGKAPSANATEDEDEPASDVSTVAMHYGGSIVSNGATKTWEELVRTREAERVWAIREGKMDDPTKPKRLDEAITIVGTCLDMCPEFERYRRERENNLDKWECLVGPDGKPTKKVDHAHAVKIYERGQGDKIIPSDLRPAPVLKSTLDYLFHDLIARGGFPDTQAFVRDRSRAVRNDFTIQQDKGPIAMECHERCTRFHILSLHLMYDVPTFDRALEIQQLMNSLLSLKEFYDDQRGRYQSPNELEMRIYHRLGLIRDQHERNDKPPPHIASDHTFQLITRFRAEVQAASSPITKTSKMKVNAAAMQTFAELAGVLRERRNIIMIYLVACFLEHIFGKDTIDDMESIKGAMTIQEVIDGNSNDIGGEDVYATMDDNMMQGDEGESGDDELGAFVEDIETLEAENMYEGASEAQEVDSPVPSPLKRGATQWLTENFGSAPTPPHSVSAPGYASASPFGGAATKSVFGTPSGAGESVFSKLVNSSTTPSIFGSTGSSSAFGGVPRVSGSGKNVFGGPVFGTPSTNGVSSTRTEEPTMQPVLSLSPQPPTFSATAGQAIPVRSSFKSLADAPVLSSAGEEDRVPPSETVGTPPPPPPFASSVSTPLNSSAPSFTPGTSSPSIGPRASLTPLRTDAVLQGIVDSNRRSFTTPTSSPSFPFPSPERPADKSPLSINTGLTLKSTGQTRKAIAIDSPVGPPPLSRKAPISLPGTPTASFSNNTIPMVGPSTPITPYEYSRQQVNGSATTTSVADAFPSSSTSYSSSGTTEWTGVPSFQGPPSSVFSSPLTNGSSTNMKKSSLSSAAIAREKSKADLLAEAADFERKHGVVQSVFWKWKQRAMDAVAWKEACRRSDAYKQKLHESASDSLTHSSSSSKRRREASDAVGPTPARRRQKRVSHTTTTPLTDEQLAERLAQNKKEHERRWAKGSFVRAIQEHIQSRHGSIPSNWSTWLCMNPDNDQTAIWLEQKFDVPNSGRWESEAIFTIPISTNPSLETFPGLIVFERTPLEGLVDDDIEKKYRVLDDCSRLRDIITMLPDRRHYTPSFLLINWDSKPGNDMGSDISDMLVRYIQEKTLRDVTTLSISSDDDLDQLFVKRLTALDVDMRGELVERLTLRDVFERLIPQWREAAFVWVDACSSDGFINWPMFSHVLEHFSDSLNAMMKNVLAAWSPNSSQLTLFPPLPFGKVRDELSVLEAIREWLRSPMFNADYLANNFSTADFNEDFEARAFYDHLLDLAFLYIQRYASGSMQQRAITKAALESAVKNFSKALEESQKGLRAAVMTLPRSPRKRISNANGMPADASVADTSESASQASSPAPSTPGNGAKRARTSPPSEVSGMDQDPSSPQEQGQGHWHDFVAPSSPTPSAAPSAAESSTSVTLAMLRALSRDVLKTYGSKSTFERTS